MSLELALRWVTPRNLLLLAALLAAAWLAEREQGRARRWIEMRLYPPQPASGPLATELEGEREAREVRELASLHAAVRGEIAAAGRRGLEVRGLERLADAALSLGRPGYRRAAREALNGVRLKIPSGQSLRSADPDGERPEIPPDLRPAARPRRR